MNPKKLENIQEKEPEETEIYHTPFSISSILGNFGTWKSFPGTGPCQMACCFFHPLWLPKKWMLYKIEDIYSCEKVWLKFSKAVGMLMQPVEHKGIKYYGFFLTLMIALNFFLTNLRCTARKSSGEKLGLSVTGLRRIYQRNGTCICMVLCVELGWGPALRAIM